MQNGFFYNLIRTRFLLMVGVVCLISLYRPSVCLANGSENSVVDDSKGVEVKDTTITEAELTNYQQTTIPYESGDFINVRVTESPYVDTTISALSCIFSLTALFLSFMSYKQTRTLAEKNIELQETQNQENLDLQKKHNRDEVRPFLCISFNAAHPFSITIKNHGQGPAILKSMKWTNNKTQTEADTLSRLLSDLFEEFDKLELRPEIQYYTKPFLDDENDRDVLAPEEELCFIRIKDDLCQDSTQMICIQKVAEFLREVEVTIEYTDIYLEETWKIVKDCSWLAKAVNGSKETYSI